MGSESMPAEQISAEKQRNADRTSGIRIAESHETAPLWLHEQYSADMLFKNGGGRVGSREAFNLNSHGGALIRRSKKGTASDSGLFAGTGSGTPLRVSGSDDGNDEREAEEFAAQQANSENYRNGWYEDFLRRNGSDRSAGGNVSGTDTAPVAAPSSAGGAGASVAPAGAAVVGSNSSSTAESAVIRAAGVKESFTLDGGQQEVVETALQQEGEPLSEKERSSYEQALGRDLKSVRIHTGAAAEEAANSIQAKAFTVGSDIVFGKGEYRPGTKEGDHLLAHEMAHVAQRGPGVSRWIRRKENGASAPSPKEEKGWEMPAAAKEALGKLVGLLPGYDLLKLVLGKDPLTGEKVSSSPDAAIKAIVGLIPGGTVLYQRLSDTRVIPETLHWFQVEFLKLNITVPYVLGLFKQAWDEMGVLKGSENLDILKRIFGAPVARIKNFILASGDRVTELILKGALKLAGKAGERVFEIINKGRGTLSLIMKDPIGFAGNLMSAVGEGFKSFLSNFVTHLKSSLQNWLLGTMTSSGLTMPETLDAKGIFHLALQILGVTYQNIRGMIVSKVGDGGEEAMAAAEKSVEVVQKMATEGPQALWEDAKEELPKMKDTVIGGIIDWVRNTIIVQAVTKLLSMFTPVGAIIEAGRGIYNTIMFFVQKANEIAALVNSIFASITNIAERKLAPAIKYIEGTMARGLTLTVNFLASYIGLGKIPEKIKEVIAKVKAPVDKALGKVTGWIAEKVKLLVGKVKGGFEKVKNWFGGKKESHGGETKKGEEEKTGGNPHDKVGLYGELKGKFKDHIPHHVPQKVLLKWIVGEAKKAKKDLEKGDSDTKGAEMEEVKKISDVIKREYEPGAGLSAISLHTFTHEEKSGIPEEEAWRVHDGKAMARQLFYEMMKMKVNGEDFPVVFVGKYNRISEADKRWLEDLGSLAEEDFNRVVEEEAKKKEQDGKGRPLPEDLTSTKAYQTQIRKAHERYVKFKNNISKSFLEKLRGTARGVWTQNFTAVRLALSKSKRDGSSEDHDVMLKKLKEVAKSSWEKISGIAALKIFE